MFGPKLCWRHKTVVLCRRRGVMPLPSSDTKPEVCRSCLCCTRALCRRGGGLAPPPACGTTPPFCVWWLGGGLAADMSAVSHSRQCLLLRTANMFVVPHSRHVCGVTQLTCLPAANVSAASRSRHVCCVPPQTRLLFHTVGIVAVSHSRLVCCVT